MMTTPSREDFECMIEDAPKYTKLLSSNILFVYLNRITNSEEYSQFYNFSIKNPQKAQQFSVHHGLQSYHGKLYFVQNPEKSVFKYLLLKIEDADISGWRQSWNPAITLNADLNEELDALLCAFKISGLQYSDELFNRIKNTNFTNINLSLSEAYNEGYLKVESEREFILSYFHPFLTDEPFFYEDFVVKLLEKMSKDEMNDLFEKWLEQCKANYLHWDKMYENIWSNLYTSISSMKEYVQEDGDLELVLELARKH